MVAGGLAGLLGIVAVTAICAPFRDQLTSATPGLLYVVPVGVAALIGGRLVAVAIGFVAAATLSIVFLPPFGQLGVSLPADAVALAVFVVVALAVGTLVGREAARRRQAEQREQDIVLLHAEYQEVVAERERLTADAVRVEVLEEVDRHRAALLRSVSHDLRTPLATIAMVASGLRHGGDYSEATRDELLELVVDEVERLDRLVANLLSMSRVEAGALQPSFEPTGLDDVVRRAADRLARALRQHEVSYHLDDLPSVPADPVQLDLVVTNLLENAARHTPEGTPVDVTTSSDDDVVRLSVTDRGPGVAAAFRPRLFDAFASGDGRTTGLGLATCRAIVEAHGGTITLCDPPGGGASFTVCLPRH
jgi:two-component system sensor histidine kinase KdpD